MGTLDNTCTNPELVVADTKEIGAKFSEKRYTWLSSLNGLTLLTGLFVLSVTKTSRVNTDTFYADTSTLPVETSTETQSTRPCDSVLLPATAYGNYFVGIEDDHTLAAYYENAAFFDEKDLEG
jgi:hypothetical protein